MRVTIDRKGFLDAFGDASAVVPSRTPKPVLQSVLFSASEDGCELVATDLQIGVRRRVLGVQVDEPGRVLLPASRVGQILKSVGLPGLEIATVGSEIVFSSLASEHAVPAADPDEFPAIAEFDSKSHAEMSQAALKQAVDRTAFAVDVAGKYTALGGVCFEFDVTDFRNGKPLSLVGTNGNRLSCAPLACQAVDGWVPPEQPPVVPAKSLQALSRMLGDDGPPVRLAFAGDGPRGTGILFGTDHATLYSRLVEGMFPRWRTFLPTVTPSQLVFHAGELLAAVESAATTTSEESRGIDFAFASGVLTLRATASDVGRSRVTVPYSGPDAKPFTLDPRFVADGLKTLASDANVTLEVIDESQPIGFKAGDWTYLVMTIRREK